MRDAATYGLALDSQQTRIEDKVSRFIPYRVRRSQHPAFTRLAIAILVQLPLDCHPSVKLHRFELLDGRACLLHLLDRRQGFIVLSRLFPGQKVEDSDLAVGQGQGDKVRGIWGESDGCWYRFCLRECQREKMGKS